MRKFRSYPSSVLQLDGALEGNHESTTRYQRSYNITRRILRAYINRDVKMLLDPMKEEKNQLRGKDIRTVKE